MTKQHFEAFAREIQSSDRTVEEKMFAALVVIRVAKQFDGRFDSDRFLKACGLG